MRRVERLARPEALYHEQIAALHFARDVAQVVDRQEGGAEGRAHLVRDAGVDDQANGLAQDPRVNRDACDARVLREGSLDVQRDAVDQALVDHLPEQAGVAAIRVQLDGKPELAECAEESWKIFVNRGFAARDHDPVELPDPSLEESKDRFFG